MVYGFKLFDKFINQIVTQKDACSKGLSIQTPPYKSSSQIITGTVRWMSMAI